MKKSIQALSAACLLFASLAAHAEDETFTFESITSVEHTTASAGPGTLVTGVLLNSSLATVPAPPSSGGSGVGARCANFFEIMMREPGVFTVTFTFRTTAVTHPPMTTVEWLKCSLTRL